MLATVLVSPNTDLHFPFGSYYLSLRDAETSIRPSLNNEDEVTPGPGGFSIFVGLRYGKERSSRRLHEDKATSWPAVLSSMFKG